MAATPDGRGYWLAAADGGVFSFGDAKFYGSLASVHLNGAVAAVAADPVTGGYWLLAADGGIFSFDAPFEGSAVSPIGPQPNPFSGIAVSGDGDGYVLLPSDPAVDPAVSGRSGFALAKQEWVGDGSLSCAEEAGPLIQGAQYLLIGERVDSGDKSAYPAAVDDFEQLWSMPEMDRTSAQDGEASADTAALNAFFGKHVGEPCN
jgi:hypothetical protein